MGWEQILGRIVAVASVALNFLRPEPVEDDPHQLPYGHIPFRFRPMKHLEADGFVTFGFGDFAPFHTPEIRDE